MLKNDINTPLLVTVTTVAALLLLVVLMGVHAWYLYEVDGETEVKWGDATMSKVHDLKEAQWKDLVAPPKWADRDKGTVKIPISQAMEMVANSGGKVGVK